MAFVTAKAATDSDAKPEQISEKRKQEIKLDRARAMLNAQRRKDKTPPDIPAAPTGSDKIYWYENDRCFCCKTSQAGREEAWMAWDEITETWIEYSEFKTSAANTWVT